MESIVTPVNNNINNIGIVKGYNKDTREVAVYIPKFMPGIAENGKQTEAKTRYNGTITSNIPYASTIKTSSYVWAAAKDMNAKMPKPDSRVILTYIDGNPDLLYWEPFNPNGDYEVIDDEKYDRLNYLTVGGRTIELYEDDELIINLPAEYRTTCIRQGKQILLNILSDSESENNIEKLNEKVGNYASYTQKKDGSFTLTPGTGMAGDIENIKTLIGGVEAVGSFTEISIAAGETIGDNIYELNSDNEYVEVPAGSTVEDGKTYYEATITNKSSGITGAIVAINNKLAESIPAMPSDDGEYNLHCSIVNGVPSYTWKKES